MSKIDLHNYEAWLLDEAEGRLSQRELAELAAFIDEHPELTSVAITDLPVLEPETILLDAHLIKDEEVCLEYVEDLLNPAQKKAVENDATLAATLSLYKATKMSPDTNEIFPDKAVLLKQPKVVVFMQPRLLRAAAAILIIGFLVWLLPNKKTATTTNTAIATATAKARSSHPAKAVVPIISDSKKNLIASAQSSNTKKQLVSRSNPNSPKLAVVRSTPTITSETSVATNSSVISMPTSTTTSTPTNYTTVIVPPLPSTPQQASLLANNPLPNSPEKKARYTSLDQLAFESEDDETEPANWNQYMASSEKTRKKNLSGRLLSFADNALNAGKKLLHLDQRTNGYAFAVKDFKVEKH